jgi:tetratricopeptide (TPR) repeat protein
VFDSPAAAEAKTHLVEATEENHHHEHNHGHAHNQHRDWIEAFGCHFQPAEHRHLEGLGQAREILPWLRLAAELDPQRVETYTVTAYWLREQLNQVKEAEAFLREGLRANPDSYEILFELGRLYAENDRDVPRARIVLELAVEKWLRQEASKVSPDHVSYRQILGQLAALEERAGNLERALAHYFRVYQVSPNPATVQKRIEELRAKLAAPQKPPP